MKNPMFPTARLSPAALSVLAASATAALLTAVSPPAMAAPDAVSSAPVVISASPASDLVVVTTRLDEADSPTPTPATAPRYQYVWKHDGIFTTKTTSRDSATALLAAARAQSGDCIVVERAGQRYLITDRYVLDHASEAYAPITKEAEQMRDFGKQQGDIARKSDGFGQQMRTAGDAMRVVGTQIHAAHQAGDTAREAELTEKLQTMAKEIKAQGAQLKPMLEEQLRPMREKMEVMRAKLKAASQESEEKMTRLLDTAFLRHMAVEIKGDATSTPPSPGTIGVEP